VKSANSNPLSRLIKPSGGPDGPASLMDFGL
jgi:hypothetical protein